MKFWSLAVVALLLAGVAATKATNPNEALTSHAVLTGVPVITVHTPATP